ncbi:IclR family transcriptional regulator domain-containing protein [Saliphagus infecundisoli]|uniref:Helix-turn-helix domain-containing protein n=1 Tax=Saliphagus infecundisoli TaxID=1849069 RepID=A0ABD5QD10_9EURY|nr:helix-turn-helix domain-containing protein [Saliphagus infecundisoli]
MSEGTDAGDRPDREGEVLYGPPEWAPVPGAMYPTVVRLGLDPETLLATFECYETTGSDGTEEPFFPIYRSTDGGRTWNEFAELRDTQHGWGLRYQPVLFEVPERLEAWETGTVLAAGNAIPADRSETSIDLYASEDGGRSWTYVSTVAAGGRAVPGRGESPVWDPELGVDADGNLVCYFSDERHSGKGYDQLVGHRVSEDGGRSWGPQSIDAAIDDGESRPGRPVVERLPTGGYVLAFHVDGPTHGGGVFLKTSPNGRDWGEPDDLGAPVRTDDGLQLNEGPYVTWVPDGAGGRLVAAGKTLRNRHRNAVEGSGGVLLATDDLSGEGPWTPVRAPLSFADELETGHRSVAWTTPLVPVGDHLFQCTSTYAAHGKTEIRYARTPLETLFEPADIAGEERSSGASGPASRPDREGRGFPEPPSDEDAEPHHVKSIVKTFELLEAVEREGPIGVTELAGRTGIGKSSVYKYLDTLRHLGFVTNEDGQYATSLRFFRFGQRVLSRYEINEIARPRIETLAERIGETVSLLVCEAGDAVYLQTTGEGGPGGIEPGHRLPVHLSTGGKAILSYLPDDRVEGILEAAGAEVDRRSLRTELERARDNRVVVDRKTTNRLEYSAGMLEGTRHGTGQQRVDERLRRVAVPIRDGEDRAIAAIEVAGPEFGVDSRRLEEDVVPLLVSTGKSIEIDLLNR